MSVIKKFQLGKYEDGSLYIERLVYPRFRVDIKFENVINFDDCDDDKLQKNLHKARIWLQGVNWKPQRIE